LGGYLLFFRSITGTARHAVEAKGALANNTRDKIILMSFTF